MPGGIFISYRRDDSRGFAGRIYDRLSDRLGSENIFFDVDNIAPGLDFVEVLTERVGACDALVAVIGKDWLASVDRTGRRRLDNAEDFVRVEIEAALKRGVRVIPVLVENAAMPQAEELPDSLRKLARRQGIAIDHARFNSDVERLLRVLSEIEEEARRARPPDAPAAGSRSDAPAVRQAQARFPTRDAVSGESQRDGPEVELSAAIWLLGDRRWQVAAIAALLTIIAALALTFGRPGPRLTVSKPEPAPVASRIEPDATISKPQSEQPISKAAPEPTISGPVPEPTVSKAEPGSPILKPQPRLALPGFEATAPTPSDGAGTEIPDDMTPHMRELKALQKQVEEQLDRMNSPAYDGAGRDAAFEDLRRQMEKVRALQEQVNQELDSQNQAAMATIREINGRSDAGAPAQQWLARADFDAKVKQQFAAGNYPDKAWGRCENGVPQAGAHWSPRPAGQFFDLRGFSDKAFKSDAADMTAKGYKMQYDNVFQSCDGAKQHQTLWMKAG